MYPRRLVRCVNQLVDPTIDAAATQSKIESMTTTISSSRRVVVVSFLVDLLDVAPTLATAQIEDVLDELEMRVRRVIPNTERVRVQPNSIGAIS